MSRIVVAARGVVSFSELEPHEVGIGIFFHQALGGLLEFLDRLIGKICQFLLEPIALIRGRLQQLNLRLFLLIDESVARREVRFESFHFAFRLFRLLHLFLRLGSLFGDDVFEVEIYFRVFTALYSALGLVGCLFVIGRREYHKHGVNT